MTRRGGVFSAALLAIVVFALTATVPVASADDYLVGLSGRARIGNFEETWQNDDPANLDSAFGEADSHKYKYNGGACEKRWDYIGMKVYFWTFGSMDVDPCDEGLFGRAQLTSGLFHTTTGVSPGDSARTARKHAVAKCGKGLHWCGTKGYILSTHRSECAGGHVPTVVARIRDNRVSSLIVNTTGCE